MQMKKIQFFGMTLAVALFMAGCSGGNVDKERTRVTELRKELYDKNSVYTSHEIAEKAIEAFRAFGKKFPEDSAALKFHTEAAEIAWTMGKHKLSTEIFREVMDMHPDEGTVPYICVRLGSIYNDNLLDTVEARKYFTRVLEKFPESDYAEGARFGLETLGMDERQQFDYMLRRNSPDKDSLNASL